MAPEPGPRSKANNQGGWYPQLDGLRAVAVILVFLHHWIPSGLSLGLIGVQLFFVLSGFLITGILLRERDEVEAQRQSIGWSLRQFYVRRILRIAPLYYFCLLCFFFLDRFDIQKVFFWLWFYLPNVYFLLKGQFYGPFSHLWSLAVEEQFYLFWPLVLFLTPRNRLPALIAILIALAPLTRAATYFSGHREFAQTSTMVWANLDTLGLGATIALLRSSTEFRQRTALQLLSLLTPLCLIELIVARIVSAPSLWVWLDPLAVSVVSMWAVWKAATGICGCIGTILSNPAVVYLGRISYGLYIWHMFAPAFVRNIIQILRLPTTFNTGPLWLILLFCWTVTTATGTWLLLEKPVNNLRRYFPYQQKPTFRGSVLSPIPAGWSAE